MQFIYVQKDIKRQKHKKSAPTGALFKTNLN